LRPRHDILPFFPLRLLRSRTRSQSWELMRVNRDTIVPGGVIRRLRGPLPSTIKNRGAVLWRNVACEGCRV
jgi:hypothetical protein